jgi:hypothetical protein
VRTDKCTWASVAKENENEFEFLRIIKVRKIKYETCTTLNMHFSSSTQPISSFALPLPTSPLRSISPLLSRSIQTRSLFRRGLISTPLRSLSDMDEAPAVTSAARSSGQMVFEPILEEGVFRFDCSVDHRAKAHPSLSFADQTVRETPIKAVSFKLPQFVPHFECSYGQQKVKIKV